MDALAKLIKKRKLSQICRVGAWIIAVVGMMHVIAYLYILWQTYRQMLTDTGGFSQVYYSSSFTIISDISSIFTIIASYLFFCIALYAASVVFEALSVPAAENKTAEELDGADLDDERIVYTSLKREEILQSKKVK